MSEYRVVATRMGKTTSHMIDEYYGDRHIKHLNITRFRMFRAEAKRRAAMNGCAVEWRKGE